MTDQYAGGFLRDSATGALIVVGKNGAAVGYQLDPAVHGAKGDASLDGTSGTDDSAAIQASIDDAYNAGGGDVLIAKRHRANNLVLKDNVHLLFVPGGRLVAPPTQAAADAVVRFSEPGSIPSSRDGSANGWVYGDAMKSGLVRAFIDGNARNGAAGDGLRFISGNGDAAYSLGAYQYGGGSESWNDPNLILDRTFVFDAGRHAITLGRNVRGARVTSGFVLRARQRGWWLKCTDSFFSLCDAGACGDGFYLDATFQSNRVIGAKSWFNYTTAAAPSIGTAWSGTGHGFTGQPVSGNAAGNVFSGCETQDNFGHGVKLDSRRAERFTGLKTGGDTLGSVGLYSSSGDCEYNDIDLYVQWADRVLTPTALVIDGANTKANNVRISDDPEQAYVGGVWTPVTLQNSGALVSSSSPSPDNKVWGPAFERWLTVGVSPAPSFENSWADAQASSGTRPVAFRMVGAGRIEIRGSVRGGALATTIFTLPVWARPSANAQVPFIARDVSVASGANMDVLGLLGVNVNGQVIITRWESASAWVAATDATGDRAWIEFGYAL